MAHLPNRCPAERTGSTLSLPEYLGARSQSPDLPTGLRCLNRTRIIAAACGRFFPSSPPGLIRLFAAPLISTSHGDAALAINTPTVPWSLFQSRCDFPLPHSTGL